jgi:thiamine-phosphate pyrophosphorylase
VQPRLIAVSDRRVLDRAGTLARFSELAALAKPGSVLFQLRDLELSLSERLSFGRELVSLAHAAGQALAVNDRLDLAVLLDADAVHLGEAGIETEDVRNVVGAELWVSRACHSVERAAELEADAVLLAPIIAARKSRTPLGLDALRRARAELERRGRGTQLFALGGVDAESAAACLAAGAHGVAVIGAVLRDANDGRGLRALVSALGIAR